MRSGTSPSCRPASSARVSAYLEELCVDTAAYERQVAAVITNIQVYGDNNAPIQNVSDSGISNVAQDNEDQGGGN
jgi:hypothetical protein